MQSYPLSEPPPHGLDLLFQPAPDGSARGFKQQRGSPVPALREKTRRGAACSFWFVFFFYFFQFSTPGFDCLSLLFNAAKGISRRRFREENMFQ